MRRASKAVWAVAACAAGAVCMVPLTTALGEDAPTSPAMSTAPTVEELMSIPECHDADTAAAVHSVLSGVEQSPAEGLLASPTEVPAGAVTAQGQAWAQLSEDERAYQQCLGAHQDLITQQAGS